MHLRKTTLFNGFRVMLAAVAMVAIVLQPALAAGSPVLNLPPYPVSVSHGLWNNGTLGGTIDITLSGVGSGYDVTDGTYPGWCIEDNFMSDAPAGTLMMLLDTTKPASELPLSYQGVPWDKVNYLLNHKNGTVQEVQAAMWLLTGGASITFPVTAAAQAMYDAAMANGAGFVPAAGQIVGVILQADGMGPMGFQDTMIEVLYSPETDPGTGTPGYWKNHPDAWPVDTITIGGIDYTKDQAIALMGMPDGDKTYTMFRALVAAKLNVLIGNDSSCIADTIAAADAWLATYGPAGSGVKARNDAWKIGEPLASTLDAYNNGYLCAPARD